MARFIYRPDKLKLGHYVYGYTQEGIATSAETDPDLEPLAEWAARMDREAYGLNAD